MSPGSLIGTALPCSSAGGRTDSAASSSAAMISHSFAMCSASGKPSGTCEHDVCEQPLARRHSSRTLRMPVTPYTTSPELWPPANCHNTGACCESQRLMRTWERMRSIVCCVSARSGVTDSPLLPCSPSRPPVWSPTSLHSATRRRSLSARNVGWKVSVSHTSADRVMKCFCKQLLGPELSRVA